MDEAPDEDPRVLYIREHVLSSMKLKPDRWNQAISGEENRQLLQDFVERAQCRTLVVTQSAAGGLQLADHIPAAASETKALYFVKRSQTALRAESMRESLVYGEISYAPLEHFCSLVEEVVVPLISNNQNHAAWPHVVSQDIRRHLHSLQSSVFVVSGYVQGKTLLPLPCGAERLEHVSPEKYCSAETVDKSLIHSLESTLIDWIHQVHAVLSRDSSEELLRGTHPTPQTELLFWDNRCADLQCIYSQLTSIKAQKMATILELVESSYTLAFNSLLQDVEQALDEAQDICVHLKPMQRLLDEVEGAEFPQLQGHMAALLHTVCLLWAHSRFYCRPARIIVLLQEICNLLLQQAQAYLVSEELLQAEVSESLGKLKISLELCHMFRKTYEERRAHLSQYQRNGNTVPPWDFSPQLVFSRLDLFTQRLVTVKEVLETAVDLFKLEKLEIGGVKGHILSQHVQILHQNFVEVYKNFANKSSACLDLTNTDFDADVRTFQLLVEDTDRRLGAIFCQAFDSNPGLEHAFKVVDLFGSLSERPLVAADAVSRYPILLSMFDQELDNTRLLYRRHIQAADQRAWTPVNKNMPAVAGGLRWVHELKRRIQSLFSMFTQLSYPCLESAAGAQVIRKYEDTMQLLDRCVCPIPILEKHSSATQTCNTHSTLLY